MRSIVVAQLEAIALKNHSVFVRIRSEDGLVGLGECYPMRIEWGARLLANFVNSALAPLVVDEDAVDVERLWRRMYFETTPRHGDKGIQLACISGVDIALWDLVARSFDVPLCNLLGGRFHSRIPMYASVGGGALMTPDDMVRAIEPFIEQGFAAFKIRMHWGTQARDVDPRKDVEMFKAVRSRLGSGVPLSFDANNGYSVPTAISQGRALAEHGLSHFEEPVAHYDYRGLAEVVNRLETPVAAGEQEYTRWQFRDLIETARVQIVQPDVLKCGGITEIRKILTLCDVYNRIVVPHNNQATIGLAATLHVMASTPFALRPQEFMEWQPELAQLFHEPWCFRDGSFEIPARAGLGLELDEERLDAFRL